MVGVVRSFLRFYIVFICAYATLSGLAFHAVLASRVRTAELDVTAVMLTHIPLKELGELEI